MECFPTPSSPGPFEVVTLIDVIEHVPDPVDLMRRIKSVMAPDGICVVVTPDVNSVAARLMGWKWWHFRAAHIGYFNKSTLGLGARDGGVTRRARSRGRRGACRQATWPKRAFSYLSRPFRPPLPSNSGSNCCSDQFV